MKKIKIRALMGYNYLISILLIVLGFSTACERDADEYGPLASEYGTPHATFIVRGQTQSSGKLNSYFKHSSNNGF